MPTNQKSGIYVRDLTTGEVRLVRGKQSYLVDPRKEIHITRTLSPHDWNLWISPGEPHKLSQKAVTTPWAISIIVPHNTAVLATTASGQRVIEGPCVTLLEYEETLVPLRLSTGTPKNDEHPLQTCFLRTVGNRVSDIIEVETSDFVRIHIRTSYSVTFLRDQKDKWFNCENYIQVMCDHLRSIVRSRTRTMPLSQLWPLTPQVVRDTILGPRAEGSEGRKGRFFAENGMQVTEVEILEAEIEDSVIAELMRNVQRESVTLTIGDRQAQEKVASQKLRAELERQQMDLALAAKQREAQLADLSRRLKHEAQLQEMRERELVAAEQSRLGAERELADIKSKLSREDLTLSAQVAGLSKEAAAKASANQTLHAEEIEHLGKLRSLELQVLEAQARAAVAERTAVQPQLVEALTALGDKALLGEVAKNMNLISLFRGKEAGEILKDVVGGTRFVPALSEALSGKSSSKPLDKPQETPAKK
jgi:major vault protein